MAQKAIRLHVAVYASPDGPRLYIWRDIVRSQNIPLSESEERFLSTAICDDLFCGLCVVRPFTAGGPGYVADYLQERG